ncbi:hypothetical protein C1645_822188 [Glomus cerebriforme]|uniref:F-box domain-containing protein n=1 Tax=Glomus cerebriforme TaxID=658196 RepID=A0A397SZH2_9GLOM|nr:hypothetical protein C1645_822188 [Glomus cerebriforme]
MACSWIFSGDLPELVYKILQYIQDDILTLHSCIFINKLWCRLAIPLLWKNPFLLKFPKNYRFIEIYLHNLDEESKSQLNNFRINRYLFPSNTLFNFITFLRAENYSNQFQMVFQKLKFFEYEYNSQNIFIFSLIKNIGKNLSINICNEYTTYFSSNILQHLGQVLPYNLEYLIQANEIILPYIKKYIMKKKRVKYLAIEEIVHNNERMELFSRKDQVKEFELYNIKVQITDKLNINIYEFINSV